MIQGAQIWWSVATYRGEMGWKVGEKLKRKVTYAYLWVIHVVWVIHIDM